MTEPPHTARHPTSDDEELLEAESIAILSAYTDAQRVLRIQDELRAGFRELSHIGKAVSIFGSARTPRDHPRYAAARALARRLGEEGYAIITGGGPGIMEAANRGAREVGAVSVGLGIELPHEQSLNDHVDIGINFHYFFTRKVMFVRYASGFVVFPGGFGTLDEMFEAATLRQTEKIRYFPIALFDSGYWRGLIDWLETTVRREGNIVENDVATLLLADDFDDVHAAFDAVQHRRPRQARRAA
ncbi:MAG TPA: TIGR00730 family Rossman fold protein [Solirubrobacter sp.]|nr:TIGR00730 family Rossman fold protein [Solirubrobacter sp.]